MWVIYVVAAGFFVAFVAMEYFAIVERERTLDPDEAGAPSDPELAPARRAVTSDEVVLAIEHRIEEELREIAYDLAAPERPGRAFVA